MISTSHSWMVCLMAPWISLQMSHYCSQQVRCLRRYNPVHNPVPLRTQHLHRHRLPSMHIKSPPLQAAMAQHHAVLAAAMHQVQGRVSRALRTVLAQRILSSKKMLRKKRYGFTFVIHVQYTPHQHASHTYVIHPHTHTQARMQRNRESAHNSRQRKKMHAAELEQQNAQLTAQNKHLNGLVSQLATENMVLKQQLVAVCQATNTALPCVPGIVGVCELACVHRACVCPRVWLSQCIMST